MKTLITFTFLCVCIHQVLSGSYSYGYRQPQPPRPQPQPDCPAGKALDKNTCRPAKVGDRCTGRSRNACVGMRGAACKGFLFKRKCKCNRGLKPAADKRSCVAPPPPTCGPGKTLNSQKKCVQAKIGSNCQGPSSAKACEGMNGAGCRGGKCQCNGQLVPAPNKRSCVPRPPPICGPGKTLNSQKKCVQAEIGSNCQAPSSAKACAGMNGAGCRGGKCQCNGDMIPAPNKRSCMPRPPPICGPGKTLGPNKMCVPAQLGSNCRAPSSAKACRNIPNARCGPSKKCECLPTLHPQGNNYCGCGPNSTFNKKSKRCEASGGY